MVISSIDKQKKSLKAKRAELDRKEKLLKEKERKVQTKKLINHGSLIEKAGISELDPKALLGALLEISNKIEDKSQLENWSNIGNEFLEKKDRKTKLIVNFQKDLGSEEKALLKNMKFSWNQFRNEWYGYSTKQEVLEKFANFSPNIEEV